MIRAIILDLDNCLATADEPGPELLVPTFDAIRQANRGKLSEAQLERAFAACWQHSLDWVAQAFGFSEEMLAAGLAATASTEVRVRMHGYPDLPILAEIPARLFLVTTGFRRLQASKVDALAIGHLFERIEIDAIDEPDRKGKAGFFSAILDGGGFKPDEVLVVGDNPESEIKAGNELGIPTVQILRPGVLQSASATHLISSLGELPALMQRYA